MIGFLFTSADGEKAHVFFLRVVSPALEAARATRGGKKREREEDFPVSTFIRFTLSLHYKVQRVSNITSTGPCK